jgi:hypothetical protein
MTKWILLAATILCLFSQASMADEVDSTNEEITFWFIGQTK